MNKPDLLRERLTCTIEFFEQNPDCLQLFYDNGKIWATGAESLSYQYLYELEITITDFPHHPDVLFVPIVEFVREQQPELLNNAEKQQNITFIAEPNNHRTFDLQIKLPLTERVIVKQEGESYQVTHADEPQPTEWQPIGRLEIYVKGEKVYERTATTP